MHEHLIDREHAFHKELVVLLPPVSVTPEHIGALEVVILRMEPDDPRTHSSGPSVSDTVRCSKQ